MLPKYDRRQQAHVEGWASKEKPCHSHSVTKTKFILPPTNVAKPHSKCFPQGQFRKVVLCGGAHSCRMKLDTSVLCTSILFFKTKIHQSHNLETAHSLFVSDARDTSQHALNVVLDQFRGFERCTLSASKRVTKPSLGCWKAALNCGTRDGLKFTSFWSPTLRTDLQDHSLYRAVNLVCLNCFVQSAICHSSKMVVDVRLQTSSMVGTRPHDPSRTLQLVSQELKLWRRL